MERKWVLRMVGRLVGLKESERDQLRELLKVCCWDKQWESEKEGMLEGR